jgi:hypothetical protein
VASANRRSRPHGSVASSKSKGRYIPQILLTNQNQPEFLRLPQSSTTSEDIHRPLELSPRGIPFQCQDNKEFPVSAASQDTFRVLFAIGKSSGGRLENCCIEACVYFCYVRDSGLYVHESCCPGNQRHLPTYVGCRRLWYGPPTNMIADFRDNNSVPDSSEEDIPSIECV